MRFLIWKIICPIGDCWMMIEVFFYVCVCFYDEWTRLGVILMDIGLGGKVQKSGILGS